MIEILAEWITMNRSAFEQDIETKARLVGNKRRWIVWRQIILKSRWGFMHKAEVIRTFYNSANIKKRRYYFLQQPSWAALQIPIKPSNTENIIHIPQI